MVLGIQGNSSLERESQALADGRTAPALHGKANGASQLEALGRNQGPTKRGRGLSKVLRRCRWRCIPQIHPRNAECVMEVPRPSNDSTVCLPAAFRLLCSLARLTKAFWASCMPSGMPACMPPPTRPPRIMQCLRKHRRARSLCHALRDDIVTRMTGAGERPTTQHRTCLKTTRHHLSQLAFSRCQRSQRTRAHVGKDLECEAIRQRGRPTTRATEEHNSVATPRRTPPRRTARCC